MHKNFEINRKKITGGCQSGIKVVTHNSKSDLFASTNITVLFKYKVFIECIDYLISLHMKISKTSIVLMLNVSICLFFIMCVEHMHKKFEINRTKIKDSCHSGRKVVTHNSKSDLFAFRKGK